MQGFSSKIPVVFFFSFSIWWLFWSCMTRRQYPDTGQAARRGRGRLSDVEVTLDLRASIPAARHPAPSRLPRFHSFSYAGWLGYFGRCGPQRRHSSRTSSSSRLFCFEFFFYCLRRFCETIVRNGYQWFSRILNVTWICVFWTSHWHVPPYECYSLPSRVGEVGSGREGGWGAFFPSSLFKLT